MALGPQYSRKGRQLGFCNKHSKSPFCAILLLVSHKRGFYCILRSVLFFFLLSVENHSPISRAFWIGRQILPLRRNIDGGGKALAALPPPCPLFQHLTYSAPRMPISMNRWSIAATWAGWPGPGGPEPRRCPRCCRSRWPTAIFAYACSCKKNCS